MEQLSELRKKLKNEAVLTTDEVLLIGKLKKHNVSDETILAMFNENKIDNKSYLPKVDLEVIDLIYDQIKRIDEIYSISSIARDLSEEHEIAQGDVETILNIINRTACEITEGLSDILINIGDRLRLFENKSIEPNNKHYEVWKFFSNIEFPKSVQEFTEIERKTILSLKNGDIPAEQIMSFIKSARHKTNLEYNDFLKDLMAKDKTAA